MDDFREAIEIRMAPGIDLSRFRVANREFKVSRDKRFLEWSFTLEEKPYMDMPPYCTIARGTYTVKPVETGPGLTRWLCTLRATYTIRSDNPRRVAWLAFLDLLRLRMAMANAAPIPAPIGRVGQQNPPRQRVPPLDRVAEFRAIPGDGIDSVDFFQRLLKNQRGARGNIESATYALLIDLSIDEGLYLDSKTTGFSATWTFPSTQDQILITSGIWKKLPEHNNQQSNVWAASMRDISGYRSWLPNKVDPSLDIIVDFGEGGH